MNQILYKGHTFGGVGEDVTNKLYNDVTIHNPITDQDETYSPVGGENAEIFNCYKDKNYIKRNIATGSYSFVSGSNNKELIKNVNGVKNNGIIGNNNILIDGENSFIGGLNNFVENVDGSFICGRNNRITGARNWSISVTGEANTIEGLASWSLVCGQYNRLENNPSGSLIVNGSSNNVKKCFQGIISGSDNTIVYGQKPFVFGQGNIIRNTSEDNIAIGSACMVMGAENKVGSINSGVAVFGHNNEVDWETSHTTNGGALIHGIENKVYHSNYSLFGGRGNEGCMQEGIVEGSSNKFIESLGSLICGCGLNSANVRQSVLTGGNSKFNNINQSIFNTLDSEIGDSYSSLVLGKEFYVPSNITNSLFLGEKNKFNETIDNNYLGKTYTKVDIYFNEPNITLFEKGITPHIWTLGEQYDVMHNIYTDQCIVFYEFNKTITPYKWSNELNKWIIPENTQNTFAIGFVNEPLLNSSITRIEVYGLETTSVTATEGQSVDCYYNYCNYKNSYTFNGNTWQLSSTYPNKKNINITQNVNNSILLGSNNNFSDDTLEVEYQTFDTVETGPIGSISQIQIISTITNDKYWQRGNSHVDPQGGTQGTFTTNDGFWSLIVDGSLILAANLFYWDNEAEKWKQPIYTNEWINPDTNVPININGATLVDLGDVNTTHYSLHDCKINKTNLDLSYMIGTLQKLDQSYQKENSYEVRGGQLVLTTLDMSNTFILGNNNNFDYNRTNLKIFSSNSTINNCYNINILGENNSYERCSEVFNIGEKNNIIGLSNSLILGSDNKYSQGINNIILGFNGSESTGAAGISDCIFIGNGNIHGSGLNYIYTVGKDNNIIQGSSTYIFGQSNTVDSINESFILGKNNQINNNSHYSMILGQNNIVTNGALNSISIGNYLHNNFQNGIVLGKYNSYPNATTSDKLLILGNGTADNNRSNCLEINEDGSQEIILQDKTLTSTLGIGKVKIKQEKIIFESLKDNSNNEKEIVEFTFEDLQSLKNIAPAQNINNTPFPQI